jgi:dTDP-4-amino-4,6-dideoxygalactose transaminase
MAIPLYKPFMPSDLSQLHEILYSGQLSYGHWGKRFEDGLATYIGSKLVMSVNSFSSAILVVLSVLDIKDGDEVICSPMSCLASNQPIATKNVKIVWADIDPLTGTLNPESVLKVISSKTKAIFHNHHCGYPGYVSEINLLAKERGIPVIDDCIEAFGSEYKEKKMGNLGTTISIFSFQTVRLPNTLEGGAISFSDKTLYDRALLIRDLGVNRKNFRDSNGEISFRSDVTLSGYGATMTEVNSYLGVKQLEHLDTLLDIQRSNASHWQEEIASNLDNIQFSNAFRNMITPNYWVFSILSERKSELLNYFKTKGFNVSGVHLPNYYYSVFGSSALLPGVEDFYKRHLALPCGWWFEKQINPI